MQFDEWVRSQLEALEAAELRRAPRTIDVRPSASGPLLDLCSNDYLGLASSPWLADHLADATREHGAGAGASRLVSGTRVVHREAEGAIARFMGSDASLLFSSGYAANVGTLAAICDASTVVFSDALNHASLIDGCRLSKAQTHVYRHGDLDHLEALLSAHRGDGRALIATEAVFSMDGDVADVRALDRLAHRFDAALFVDEAHALGVLGPEGRGLCARENVVPTLRLGTLGKALGMHGAFVAASAEVIALLENRARSYVFSTGTAPAIAAVLPQVLEHVARADDARARIVATGDRFRTVLRANGFAVPDGDTPIVPLVLGSPRAALASARQLLERDVFVQAIRPPTVPAGTSRLRIVATAAHGDAAIAQAVDALGSLRPELRS